MKAGMAELKRKRALLSVHFKEFKSTTVTLIAKHAKQRAKVAKGITHLSRRRLLMMWSAL